MRSVIYVSLVVFVMCVAGTAKAEVIPCAEGDTCFNLGATEGVLAHFPADVHWGHLNAFLALNGIPREATLTLQSTRADGNPYVIPQSMRGSMPSREEIAASLAIMEADEARVSEPTRVTITEVQPTDVAVKDTFVDRSASIQLDQAAPEAASAAPASRVALKVTDTAALARAQIAEEALLAERSSNADFRLAMFFWVSLIGGAIVLTLLFIIYILAKRSGGASKRPADLGGMLDDFMERDPDGFTSLIESKLLSFSIPITTPKGVFHLQFSHCIHSRSGIRGPAFRRLMGVFIFNDDSKSLHVPMSLEEGERHLRNEYPELFEEPVARLRAV